MAHPPARQGEPCAYENMHQEEEDQKQVQFGMKISRLLQREDNPIPPGISWDQEYDHKDQKHPGANSIDLD